MSQAVMYNNISETVQDRVVVTAGLSSRAISGDLE